VIQHGWAGNGPADGRGEVAAPFGPPRRSRPATHRFLHARPTRPGGSGPSAVGRCGPAGVAACEQGAVKAADQRPSPLCGPARRGRSRPPAWCVPHEGPDASCDVAGWM